MTQATQAADGFTSAQVSAITGATLRQLQWWDEQAVLKPWFGVRLHVRLYSREQVELLARMVQLRKAGVSLQHLRNLAKDLANKPFNSIVVTKQSAIVVGDTLVVFQGRVR